MKTAVELEIFTAIAEGNTTAATIAKRCEGAERGVRTLCDFLTIHGFLTKEGKQYALAPDSLYSSTGIRQHMRAFSKSAGFVRVELAPPEIGLDRLVIAHR